jgi:hypothetical protein
MRIATLLLMSQDPKAIVRLKAPFPPPDVVVYRSHVRRCVVTAQGIAHRCLLLYDIREALTAIY